MAALFRLSPPSRLAWPSLCPTPISHAATTSEGVDYSTGLGLRLYNACIVGRVGLGHHPPTRPSLFLPHFYCGHAFLTPLLAWPRVSYPTSSVALRFTPPLRCAGASVVRPCPSPVGRAQLFPKRSNNFLVLGSSASLIGSELSTLVGSGLYTVLGRAFVSTFGGAWKAFSPKFAPNSGSWHHALLAGGQAGSTHPRTP